MSVAVTLRVTTLGPGGCTSSGGCLGVTIMAASPSSTPGGGVRFLAEKQGTQVLRHTGAGNMIPQVSQFLKTAVSLCAQQVSYLTRATQPATAQSL